MKRIEWVSKMMVGWVCGQILFNLLLKDNEPPPVVGYKAWLLSWGGFYTFDNGYLSWLEKSK